MTTPATTPDPSAPAASTAAASPPASPPASPLAGDARRALGAYGETLAARHLTARGMVLLDRNWHAPGGTGEIDLVLRDGDVLVICEVKTRTSDVCGTPHEGVSREKLDRMRRLAAQWLRAHEVHPTDIRFDMVAVLRPRKGPSRLEHVAGLS